MTVLSRLAAYYPCDNTHGRSLSEDVVGENDGTAGIVSSATGKVRQGMFFLASGEQFRSVPNASVLQELKGICCWVKFTTLAADMTLLSKGSDATDANTSIKLWYDHSDTDLAFTVGDASSATTIRTDGLTLAVDTWYHIRVFNDGSRMGIAVNGTLYGSGTSRAPLPETGLLYLGRDFGGNYLDGVLDEVALFSIAPTIADGASLYNGGTGASLPLPDLLPGSSGRAGVSNRWLPPSFAESDDATAYLVHGKIPVQRFDGALSRAGIAMPSEAVTIKSSGKGSLTGNRYAYLRNLDASGRVSSVSPLSEVHKTFGTAVGEITGATNSSPIVITSASHGLITGDTVEITGQSGNTAANGVWRVTVLSTGLFELDSSSGNGDWSSSAVPTIQVTSTQTGGSGTNQAQTLSYSNTPTTGSFTLSFRGEATTSLAYDASAATIQSALEAVSTVGVNNVICTGGDLPTDVVVTFRNNLGSLDLPLMVATYTGATSSVVITETRKGSSGDNEVQEIDLIMLPTGGTFTLTYSGQTTGTIAYNASAATVQTALEALSNLTSGDVLCTGGDLPGNVVAVEFAGTLAETDVDLMTANGSSLTGSAITVGVSTTTEGSGPDLVWDFNSDFVDSEQGVTLTGNASGPQIDTGTKHLGAGSVSGGSGYNDLTVTGLSSGVLPEADEDFSVACWVRRGSTWNNPSGLLNFSDGFIGSFNISLVTSGSIRALLNSGSGTGDLTALASSVVPLNTWTHIVVVHDSVAKTLKIYADGSLSDTATYTSLTPSISPNKITFMYNALTSTNVDELSVWHVALSAGDVTSLYNSGTGEETPYSIEANEEQQITITGSPSAGAFTLTYDGQTTSSLAYNVSAANVDAALEALSNVGAGDVTCTGGPLPGTAIDVEFTGALAGINVSEMTATPSSAPSMTTGTTTPGVASTTFDLANAAYDSKSGVAANGPGCWTADGKGFFSITARTATFYSASTAYDPSTFNGGNVVNAGNLITGSLAAAYDVCLSSTGDYVYILFENLGNSSDTYASSVVQFEHDYSEGACSFLQSTGNEALNSFGATPYGICIGDSDTKLYIAEAATANIRQYSMTANDLTTVAYSSKFIDVSAQTTLPRGMEINDDGTEIYVATGSTIYQYTLTTGYDADTGSYATVSLDNSTETTAGNNMAVRPNGEKLYVLGYGGATYDVFQYAFSSGGTNEVQSVTAAGGPVAGTFTLTYSGQTTAALDYDSTAAEVQAGLVALSNLDVGDVICTSGPLPDTSVTITFGGALANTDVAQISVDDTGLLVSVATTIVGTKAVNELQTLSTDTPPGTGTFTLTFGGQTTGNLSWNATAASIKTKLEALTTVGTGNVEVAGGPINSSKVRVEFKGSLSTVDTALMTATSSMTQTSPVINVAITTTGSPGVNEIQVLEGSDLSGGTFTVASSGDVTDSLAFDVSADELKQAIEALSDMGNGNVLVTGGPLGQEQFIVEFIGDLGSTDIATLTTNTSALLNGGWAGGASKITYSDVEVPTDTNVTRRQILRSKPGAVGVFYIDIDEEDVTSNTFSSTKLDSELEPDVAVVMLDSNGVDTNLSRHGVPPNYKRVVSAYQNRMFFGVNYVERSMVTISGDSATGVATDWPNVFDGRTLYQDSGKGLVEVDADSQTAALSESTTTTQTASQATIAQAAPDEQRVYHSWVTGSDSFPESVHPNRTFQFSRNSNHGNMTSSFVFNGNFYVGFKAAIYQYAFNTDPTSLPDGDGRVQLVVPRGVCNNRTIAYTDDLAVIMDREGVFMFDGNTLESVSGPIKPVFTGAGTPAIQWANQEWFHAAYFATQRTVRFFVTLDGGPYPRHALCFNVDQRFWWVEEYPWPVTSSAVGVLDGQSVVFLGSTGRRVFTLNGNRDGLAAVLGDTQRGTATGSGWRTLTDSAATFTSSLAGSVLTIVEGTGRGQRRTISSVSGTTLTLKNHWGTRPSTDSVYQIGGVAWSYRTGKLLLNNNNQRQVRRVEMFWQPTSKPSSLSYEVFADWNYTANVNKETRKAGSTDGVSTTKDSTFNKVDLTVRGHVEQEFGGNRPEGVSGEKFVAVSVSGVINDERLRLLGLAVAGGE
jgi:hypothetical protein